MKINLLAFFLIVFISAQSFCNVLPDTIIVDGDIQLIPLRDSVFMHKTYHQGRNGRFPSNGLLIIKNGEAVLVDTPMDNDKTERMIKYLNDSLNVKVLKLIIGHFHADCMGGINYIHSKNIESVACYKTIKKCKEDKLPVPKISFKEDLIFDFNGMQICCKFFGPGHSFDNITVWIPGLKILYGGCMVKSLNARNIGNTSDAVINEWVNTIKKIQSNYNDINIVIPGHGNYGGPELLTKTIEIVETYQNGH